MRPCKVFAKALEVIKASEGEITPDWVQQASGIDKRRSWFALQIAVKKGLIKRTGYGKYRSAPQPVESIA